MVPIEDFEIYLHLAQERQARSATREFHWRREVRTFSSIPAENEVSYHRKNLPGFLPKDGLEVRKFTVTR